MIAKNIMSNLVPPLKTSDTGDKALIWMHEFGVGQLPIVNNEAYLGLITEDDILDMSEPLTAIGSHELRLPRPMVNENDHIFEVIKKVIELKLSLIPVVDEKEHYLGVITQENIIQCFGELSSITDSGGILVLDMNMSDYSLVEIARIVESNNALILSSHIFTHTESSKVEVVLKVNVADLRNIIATFERFEYVVSGSFQESEYMDQLKDRYNALMNYLNI